MQIASPSTSPVPPPPPIWFKHVVRYSLNATVATRVTMFLLARDDWMRKLGEARDPPIPDWLSPTPDKQECQVKGWPSLKVTPLQFIELFGENLYAHQVSKAARILPLVTQHVVLCLAPNPGTGIGSPPFAAVLEPTVDVPTMAPLYLGSDLTPKPQFVVLPEFPDNRPNMLCSGMNIRIPLFDKANPLLFRGIDNDWQPFPLYYSPSQVELAVLPPHIYRNYISAVMKYKVLKLQSVICRWCQTRVGLDMFTPQIRSKIRGKPSFAPVCRICRGPDPSKPVAKIGPHTLYEDSEHVVPIVQVNHILSPKWQGLQRSLTLVGSDGEHLPLMGCE